MPVKSSVRRHPGEKFNYPASDICSGAEKTMAKNESSSGGLMSSAGLMRYFEAEESAIKIDPKTVVIAAVGLGIVVWVLNVTIAHVI